MQFTAPYLLDKQVEEAATAQRIFSYRLREDFEKTLEERKLRIPRAVSSRAAFETAQGLHEASPGKDGLVAWVAALTIERVTLDDFVEAQRARHSQCSAIRELGKEPRTLRQLIADAVFSKAPEQRYAAARGVERNGDEACSNALFWMARRHEAARQLGLPSLATLEWPTTPELAPEQVVARVLARTEDLASEALGAIESWENALARATAHDAQHGWPVRLSTRWLDDQLREGEWLRGLRLSLGPIPETYSGATYARGLARLGAAFRRAAMQRPGSPFAMRSRPYDAGPYAHGAMFASWLISPAFVSKRMGLGKDAARAHLLAFSRSMLLSLRFTAAQARVGLSTSPQRARESHADLSGKALRAHINPELAGLLPRYNPHSAARLIGSLLGAREAKRMMEEFDEDWFNNPRAQQKCREVDITQVVRMDADTLEQGVNAAAELLARAFQ